MGPYQSLHGKVYTEHVNFMGDPVEGHLLKHVCFLV